MSLEPAINIVFRPIARFRALLRLHSKAHSQYQEMKSLVELALLFSQETRAIDEIAAAIAPDLQVPGINSPISINRMFLLQRGPFLFDLHGDIFGVPGLPIEHRQIRLRARIPAFRPIVDKRMYPAL